MPPVALIVLAMALYALQNTVIDQKLRSVPPLLMVTVISGVVFLLAGSALFFQHVSGTKLHVPDRQQLLAMMICGLAIFGADYFMFKGYGAGVSLMVTTTVPIILPVLASVMTLALTGNWLATRYVIASWLVGSFAVYLVNLK